MALATAGTRPGRSTRTVGATSRPKRLDIQGLRAVAVLLVVLYHAGVEWLPGGYVGVDVFFVISGFLITGGLVDELHETGKLSWTAFYARRVRRILPAATVTLLVTAIFAFAVLPPIRRDSIGWDVVASSLYVQNWRLDAASTDYLTATAAPSPLQHFWSLAVEEQFYVLWPLLLLGAGVALARLGARSGLRSAVVRERWLTPVLLVAVALIGVPSLAASVYLTSNDPAGAYFVTHTRLWELAVGAVLAICAGSLGRIPRALAWPVGWAGIVAIGWSASQFTNMTPFPGYHALLPTVGAAAVIVCGFGAVDRRGPVAVLGLPPFTWVGDLSYSYYLWHWPLLVVAPVVLDESELTVSQGLVVVAAALVPSWLSYRFVEQTVLRRSPEGTSETLLAGVVAMAVAALAGFLLVYSIWPKAPVEPGIIFPSITASGEDAQQIDVGATVLDLADPSGDPDGVPVDQVEAIYPSPGSTGVAGCSSLTDESEVPDPCRYGSAESERVVVLLGDSHAGQWARGLSAAAVEANWLIVEYTRQSCPTSGVPVADATGAVNDACSGWVDLAVQEIVDLRPDVVMVSGVDRPTVDDAGTLLDAEESLAAHAAGYAATWQTFTAAGIDVVALADTPRPPFHVPDCVSQHEDELTRCVFPRNDGRGEALRLAAAETGVPLVDVNDAICPGTVCAPVIGGYLVYHDDNHITATYGETLAGHLRLALESAVPTLVGD